MKSEALQTFFRRVNREINWLRSDLKRIGSYRSWFPVGRHGRKIKAADGSPIRWQEIPYPASKRTHTAIYPIPSERFQSNWNTHRDIRADYNSKRCDGVSEFLGWFDVEYESILDLDQCRLENGTLPTVQFDGLEQDVFLSVEPIYVAVLKWYVADDGHWSEFRSCRTKRESKAIQEQIQRSESQFPLDVKLLKELQAAVNNARLRLAGKIISVPNSSNSEQLEALGESLDPNSKIILQTMLELNCNEFNRLSATEIIKAALYSGDEKRAFNQLKRLGLVTSKEGRSGGYWLTEKGTNMGSKINGGTVTPTDCTV